jgi:ankyrin repeat protein
MADTAHGPPQWLTPFISRYLKFSFGSIDMKYALFVAADKGNLADAFVILNLIQRCPEIRDDYKNKIMIDLHSRGGLTALSMAVCKNHFHFAEMLIKQGATIDIPKTIVYDERWPYDDVRKPYSRPLHRACMNHNSRMVKLLLDNGADPNSQEYDSNTALKLACNEGLVDVTKMLLAHGANVDEPDHPRYLSSPLHIVCKLQEMELLEVLLNWHPDLECLNEKCRTPLHLAVLKGLTAIVKRLVENGANVNYHTISGETLLHECCLSNRKSNVAIVDLVLKAGAKVNERNLNGETPILCAVHEDVSHKIIELLIAAKANVNECNESGKSPVMMSLSKPKTLETLLKGGADVNQVDAVGWSPLHHAAWRDSHEAIKCLVTHGARLPLYFINVCREENKKLLLSLKAFYDNPKQNEEPDVADPRLELLKRALDEQRTLGVVYPSVYPNPPNNREDMDDSESTAYSSSTNYSSYADDEELADDDDM